MIRRRLVLAGIAPFALALAAAGADWPEFRGPTGQGLAAGPLLPTEWGKHKHIAWKQAIPGKGWSSPIVCNGRVYLTTAVPGGGNNADQSLRALCVDSRTGKLIWDVEVFRQDGKSAPGIHPKNSHASPTPITDGERLYVHFGHQGTACLELSGKVQWRNTELRYSPIHGNGGSPILAGDLLVFSCDGGADPFVAALEKATGKVRWKTPRSVDAARKFSFSTPLLIEVEGKQQIISPGSEEVCAYDPENGAEIWRVRHEGYSVIPRPVYGHGLVFVCTGYNSPALLAIRPDGRGDVTKTHVAWTTRKGVPHESSLLLVGDELLMVSDAGMASCLDARTGKVHWSERLEGTYSASPLAANSKVYFSNEAGLTTVFRAAKVFDVLARNDLSERTQASLAAAEGALFIRTETHLYRIQQP